MPRSTGRGLRGLAGREEKLSEAVAGLGFTQPVAGLAVQRHGLLVVADCLLVAALPQSDITERPQQPGRGGEIASGTHLARLPALPTYSSINFGGGLPTPC
jgi:hypothetical protein